MSRMSRRIMAVTRTGRQCQKWLQTGLRASYSIEATYIMAITFFALATVFGAAYRLKEEITGRMRLHEQVEQLRYREESDAAAIVRRTGGNGWSLEIRAEVFDQETWLRKISLAEEYLEEFTKE